MLLIPLLSSLAIASSAIPQTRVLPVSTVPQARYVFLFIGDGMGLAQVALAEAYQASISGDTLGFEPVSFSRFPVLGMATTQCATRRITESSAAATALATGSKAADGTLGLSPGRNDTLRTIAEEARDAGRKVGILTTVSVDHATPAGFYAHVASRGDYNGIGMSLPRSGFDVFAGAGFIAPVGNGNVWQRLQTDGYFVAQGRAALQSHQSGRVVALAPVNAPANALPWELDRPASSPDQPTLSDFVRETTRLLEGNPQGFFVMVEGGRIDWAGHGNDAGAAIGEVRSLDSAVLVALAFAARHPGEVLIVVTGDHETGGLALGRTALGYQSNLGLFQYQKSSQDALVDSLQEPLDLFDSIRSTDSCMAVIGRRTGLGIEPLLALSASDRERFMNAWATEHARPVGGRGSIMGSLAIAMLAEKAGVGWSSTAHTSIPVPVYAWGAGAEAFQGRMDNTDIAKRLRQAMGIGLKPLRAQTTERLVAKRQPQPKKPLPLRKWPFKKTFR